MDYFTESISVVRNTTQKVKNSNPASPESKKSFARKNLVFQDEPVGIFPQPTP